MQQREKVKLERFNTEMGKKISALKFSKKVRFTTTVMDEDFVALADTDYGK